MKRRWSVWGAAFFFTGAVGCSSAAKSDPAGGGGANGDGGTSSGGGGGADGSTSKPGSGPPKVTSNCAPEKVTYGVAADVATASASSPSVQTLAVGDFDGDGAADIVVTDRNAINVVLSKKDGSFGAPLSTAANPGTNGGIATGDFDGDGNIDVVLEGAGGDSIDCFLGKGDGTFKIPVNTPASAGALFKIVPVDVNGDGKLDLYIAGTSGGEKAAILLNSGGGSFSGPGAAFSLPDHYPSSELDFADLNGDGSGDVAFLESNSNSMCTSMSGNGGSFGAVKCYQATQSMNNGDTFTRIGDVNGDGKPDLVALNRGGSDDIPSINVWMNKGDGTFEDRVPYTMPRISSNLLVIDTNNDKKAELVRLETYSTPQLDTYPSKDGKFTDPPVTVPFGGVVGTSVAPFAAGDFLGNGLVGFASLKNYDGKVSVLTSTCKP